jgi:hypothetical protein
MLQGQKYHSLSMSKVIEKTLIAYYKQISDSSDSYLEIAISDKLNEYVKKYLVDKVSPAQKVSSLVIKNYVNCFIFIYYFTYMKVAAYLDPETHHFLTDSEIKKVEDYFKKEYPFNANNSDQYSMDEESNTSINSPANCLKKFANELCFIKL